MFMNQFYLVITSEHLEKVLQKLIDMGLAAGKNILLAIVVYIAGRFIIKLINRLMLRTFARQKVELSVQTFLKSFINILLTIILIVSVISVLGINTTSIAALLASAGVAVGMALSGNLQNLAGGLIILVFKPYKVGDYIEAQGTQGTVREIQIFHTIVTRPDSTLAYVPNGAMSSGLITNYSRNELRRLDFVVGVDYGVDVSRVEEITRRIVDNNPLVLSDPAPFIAVDALAESSVNVLIRVWSKTTDYWKLYYDLRREIYDTYNREGIDFPFPQQTVHIAKS
ncbi:putative small-conductance mechanosensitive channel [Prevotella sp. CAG:617]|nr:putative small-conductance mechanosensitive channel [Prevotella sp. CAG:617]